MSLTLAGRLALALVRDLAQLGSRLGLPCLIRPRPAWVTAQARAMGAQTTHRTDPSGTLTQAPTTPRGHLR